MDVKHIRNFSIIAHIDHGKSTLADRLLEATHTVATRDMKEQVLDSMELERERGITIKMQPVRMNFSSHGVEYTLNLIDTPGHIDFSYEVSRALKAVEGTLLLVDSTQGVQAQTLTTLSMAEELGLTIIPVLTKIDSPLARIDETKLELASLLNCDIEDILEVSGKTGEGVDLLLETIVKKIPHPKDRRNDAGAQESLSALVFDFEYSTHQGIIVYVRVLGGSVMKNDSLLFAVAGERFIAGEVGVFVPKGEPRKALGPGEIGYIVTGIKSPGIARVGETITSSKHPTLPLEGYAHPSPVVWASLYPESEANFDELRQALDRLKLTDSSLSFEEEVSGSLGRGYRAGFLGMLHLEIVVERLRREFDLELVVTTPSITYEVETKGGKKEIVYSPVKFPDAGEIVGVREPWMNVRIIVPSTYIGSLLPLLYEHEAEVGDTAHFGDGRSSVSLSMPLREMMRNFFDELKSISSGYASLSYTEGEMREADVTRLDILVSDEIVPAFSRVVSTRRVQEEAEEIVERLHESIPRQMIVVKIQAKALGRILSSKTISAYRKDVTQHMYGGDITRKMKLREKQKKGKKNMQSRGSVNIPHDVFLKVMKGK
jgi:GTP-binding protein LepA